jgi:mRNA interferase RelE/StbE
VGGSQEGVRDLVSYTIELRPGARRDLENLPQDTLQRVSRRIDSLADNPRPPGAEKLSGSENSYRVRVGDYRILYEIRDKVLLIIIVRIRHRREVYRN